LHAILPALATCLALLHYAIVTFNAARARGKYKVEAPATTGNPAFERAYRVQMNTLEQIVFFLPALWLFSYFSSPSWGGVLGLVWVGGRAYYAWSYYRDPASRGPGFMIATTASIILFVGGFVGVMVALGRTGL
jgi:glutathione S-transferase